MSEAFMKALVEKRHKMLTHPANVEIEEITFTKLEDSSSEDESVPDMPDIKPVPLERTPAPLTENEPPVFDTGHLEREIMDTCALYKQDATFILMQYNYKPRLTAADIADIKKNIKALNELFEDNLGAISQDLPQGVNFAPHVYDNIDATEDMVRFNVERFIIS